MGSEDPRQSPIAIHWTVNGKAVPVGISNLPLLDAAGAMVSVTAQLDAGAAKLRLISAPGAKVSAIVSAAATDFAGTTATDSIVFESWGSVDGLHPDDYAVLVGCIADNIPGIPIDPTKFKRPTRDPQFLEDLWMHEAFREVNKLEAHGLDAINVRNLRHLVNMQAVHPFG